jgi:hypothetical protein
MMTAVMVMMLGCRRSLCKKNIPWMLMMLLLMMMMMMMTTTHIEEHEEPAVGPGGAPEHDHVGVAQVLVQDDLLEETTEVLLVHLPKHLNRHERVLEIALQWEIKGAFPYKGQITLQAARLSVSSHHSAAPSRHHQDHHLKGPLRPVHGHLHDDDTDFGLLTLCTTEKDPEPTMPSTFMAFTLGWCTLTSPLLMFLSSFQRHPFRPHLVNDREGPRPNDLPVWTLL